MKVVKANEMQALDRQAVEKYGIPSIVLMENAGLRIVEAMHDFFDTEQIRRIAVVSGKGNNGGDSFVVARHLKNAGYDIEVFLVADPKGFKGNALTNFQIIDNMKLPIFIIDTEKKIEAQRNRLNHCDILVDGIFGTGLSSAPRGHYAYVINAMNESGKPIVAVDIPSGLHPDKGIPFSPCITAELTVTFGLPKIGQIIYPGYSFCGELVVGDISFPEALFENPKLNISLLDSQEILLPLLNRAPDTHKGNYGHLFILAGSTGKTGAAVLAAEGASSSGAGLVTVGIANSLNSILENKLTEVMTEPLAETEAHTISSSAIEQVREICLRMTALAIGPGISQHKETGVLLRTLIEEIGLPMVIDADGLNLLAGNISVFQKKQNKNIVLTPHPGEMARLLEISTSEVQADRIAAARKLSLQTGCITVLKGARSIIAAPDGRIEINMTGNPGMACGGIGDVLTGIIGALLAEGYDAWTAAKMGTYLHGAAGDVAAEEFGEVSLQARHLLNAISSVLLKLNE